MISNLSKEIVDAGGDIIPLLIPSTTTNGTGLMNPSIYIDGEDILLNLRHVQYTFFYSEKEKKKFHSRWGPLVYIHPDDDCTLRTENYLCKLDPKTLEIRQSCKVDTSLLDVKPVWEFIGLEDARLFKWNNKYYLCGVRRDTKTNGEGRMEFSEIEFSFDKGQPYAREIKRNRIEPPNDPNSYCEKNWMPILDEPFHFVKWTNPTEVVEVDVENNSSKTIFLADKYTPIPRTAKEVNRLSDLRGSSHVIKFGDGWLAFNHEVDNFKHETGWKDALYLHRIVYWDKDWNLKKVSEEFHMLDATVEFGCGLADYGDYVLYSFGYYDNCAYLAKIPKTLINKLLKDL